VPDRGVDDAALRVEVEVRERAGDAGAGALAPALRGARVQATVLAAAY
jgi:hypothetical protein